MEKLHRLFRAPIVLALLIFTASAALADAVAPTQTNTSLTLVAWGLASALLAQTLTFVIKRVGGFEFFHKPAGTLILAALAAAGGSFAVAIKGGWNTTAVLLAVGNGLLNFLITANAANPTTVLAMKAKRASASGSPLSKQAAMLAVLTIAFLGLGAPTCDQFKTCELNALPATVQTVIVTVVKIALDTSKTVDDIGQAVSSLSPTQGPCVVQAVSSWLDGQMPAHGQALPDLVAAAAKLHAYLAKHPATACRGWPRTAPGDGPGRPALPARM